MLIPSIDILDGKAVQLQQGNADKKIVEVDDVFSLLEKFSLYGEVAIIDLNAALGRGNNKKLIEKLLQKHPCRVGGGIRDYKTARDYLSAGAKKIILGTSAESDFIKQLPKPSLIFAIDANGDNLTTHGWQKTQDRKVRDVIKKWGNSCSEFLYTQVKNEGMMQGLDRQRIEEVIKTSNIPVTIAGGISDYDDLNWLHSKGVNSQIGMSIYTGKISLRQAFCNFVDFKKSELIPTIVQDYESGKVLMLAYSNRNSLEQALTQNKGVYFSRSRQCLWEKGATSGNTQKLVHVDLDCDNDTLLFQVNQIHSACHLNRYSCFPSQTDDYDLYKLDNLLTRRKTELNSNNLKKQSFSQTVLANPELQVEKLEEECQELIEAETFEDIRWEAADLLFFTLIRAKAKGVGLKDLINELGSRHVES